MPAHAHPTRTAPHCIQCAHFVASGELCNHPAMPVDPVTGAPALAANAARGGRVNAETIARFRGTRMCGEAASLFAPRADAAGADSPTIAYLRNRDALGTVAGAPTTVRG